MSEKLPPRGTAVLTAEVQIPFKYVVIHGTDPSRRSAEQKSFTKTLNLMGLTFDSPRMEVDGFHLSFTESAYGRNALEMVLDLGKRFGSIELLGQVDWYERRNTLTSHSFIVGVGFIDVQADALDLLRDFLYQVRTGPSELRR
jgi:hypothetical protein